MPLERCTTFGEAAAIALSGEQAVLDALPHVRIVCSGEHVPGLKKKLHEASVDAAFNRALSLLELRFNTPSVFREAISHASAPLADIDRQMLFNFAAKWEQYLKNLAQIAADKAAINQGARDILIVRGTIRQSRVYTREELEQKRLRKAQSKEARMRKGQG